VHKNWLVKGKAAAEFRARTKYLNHDSLKDGIETLNFLKQSGETPSIDLNPFRLAAFQAKASRV
jgi:hypothetical protein